MLGEFFAELYLIFADLFFWKKKKARRKYEQENNLPKKRMISPSGRVSIIFVIIMVIISVSFFLFYTSTHSKNTTKDRLLSVTYMLMEEKETFGSYPTELKSIIRNNPMNADITKDGWNREFFYETTTNGQEYTLISKGKDGILDTDDDINSK